MTVIEETVIEQTGSAGATVPIVDARAWTVAAPPIDELGEDLVHLAALGSRELPIDVDAALVQFAATPHRSGALLIRNAPIGDLPPTPPA